ncbi:hypothetical protein ANCDUO_21862, partial [Ancylostoma duodenale]
YNINWTKLFQESMEPEYGYQGGKGNVSAPKEEKVLFKTTFTNTTQREQEYSFKTERCTSVKPGIFSELVSTNRYHADGIVEEHFH